MFTDFLLKRACFFRILCVSIFKHIYSRISLAYSLSIYCISQYVDLLQQSKQTVLLNRVFWLWNTTLYKFYFCFIVTKRIIVFRIYLDIVHYCYLNVSSRGLNINMYSDNNNLHLHTSWLLYNQLTYDIAQYIHIQTFHINSSVL